MVIKKKTIKLEFRICEMPHPYGMHGFNPNPSSPPGPQNVLATRSGQTSSVMMPNQSILASSSQTSALPVSRLEDKRLTREAMEKYLRDRNDMIIVILHAKASY